MKLIPSNKLLVKYSINDNFLIIDPRWKWDDILLKKNNFPCINSHSNIILFLDEYKIKYELFYIKSYIAMVNGNKHYFDIEYILIKSIHHA